MYSSSVRRLLRELPNRGECADYTHRGRAENPVCGDVAEVQLRVREDMVVECRFQAYGCPGALAAAAGLTELVKGETLDSCSRIDAEVLLEYIGGLPKHKEHGAHLALTALRDAVGVCA